MYCTILDPHAFAQIIPPSLPVYLAVLTHSQDSAQAFFSETFPLDAVGMFSSVQLLPLVHTSVVLFSAFYCIHQCIVLSHQTV